MSEQKDEATLQMVEAILTKGHSENQDYFSSEKSKIEEEYAIKLATIEQESFLQRERLTNSISQEYAQREQHDLLHTNQGIEQEKRQHLADVFDLGVIRLQTLEQTDFLKVVGNLFTTNDLRGKVTVQVGEYSQSYLTADVLAGFASQHSAEISYQLIEPVLRNDGGFILAQDGIEYNFLFSSILAQISEEKEFELAEELFADRSD